MTPSTHTPAPHPSLDEQERALAHVITSEAAPSASPWGALLSWDSLRYHGTGWWLDRLLPGGPRAFLAAALLLPALAWLVGLGITADRGAYLGSNEVTCLAPFLALHLVSMRMLGALYRRSLAPAMDALGIPARDRAFLERGLFGAWGNLGALGCAAYFIARDTWLGLRVDPATGLTGFTDPERWDLATLGPRVHDTLLATWNLEWLVFGYFLWVQLWMLLGVSRTLVRHQFDADLGRILVHNEYRHFFALVSRTATLCLAFALGNLAYVFATGELFPRPTRPIAGPLELATEMTDLLSTAIVFGVLLASFFYYISLMRRALTLSVNRLFAEAGDRALVELQRPLALRGDATVDLELVRARLESSSGLLKAIVFQREVDALGARNRNLMLIKAALPVSALAFRILGLLTG